MMVALSFNEVLRKYRHQRGLLARARKRNIFDDIEDDDDVVERARERPGDAGADITDDNGDGDSTIEAAARWLVRSRKTPDMDAARAWLNTMRGATFLARSGKHFGKRQRAAMRKTEPATPITSQQLVEAAKACAVEKYGGPPDVAFVKLLESDDGDGASLRRVNAKLRHRELYGASASAPTPAFDALKREAEALRKADPKLTKEQSFAKAYDSNPQLREAERAERYRKINAPLMFEVSTTPLSIGSLDADKALEQINTLARRLNAEAPYLSFQQCWSRIYSDNPELARAEREQRRSQLGVG
jgi:hypothetical protein